MTTVRYFTHDELMHELESLLEEERMTVEEFRAEGEADTLTDGHLRDMWLWYRPLLFDEKPTQEPRSEPRSLDVACEGVQETSRSVSRLSTPQVRYFTRDELWQEMEARLEEERITVEEFRAEGEADTLTDGYLRDLWLWYRPVLFDE